MSANISSFFRLCYDDCVQADTVFSWRPDVGVLEAGRGQSRSTQDAGVVEAGRGQSGRKTWALWRQDAGRHRVKLFLGSTVQCLLSLRSVLNCCPTVTVRHFHISFPSLGISPINLPQGGHI
jgi:hypothetical protein